MLTLTRLVLGLTDNQSSEFRIFSLQVYLLLLLSDIIFQWTYKLSMLVILLSATYICPC